MSYRIEYDGRIDKYEIVQLEKSRLPLFMVISFCAFLLATLCFWPEGEEQLKSMAIPGNNAVTVQAFRNMTDDLRSGAGLGDAVFTFCHSVIHGN